MCIRESRPIARDRASPDLLREIAHDLDEVALALEADAWQVRHHDVAILDTNAVGEAAIGLEQVRIALVAAEAEAGGNVARV